MLFPFHIAKRYIISKKSHHSINWISYISVGGVAIATAAMVCILSVFNGFEDLVSTLFTSFDPALKVVPTEGKYVDCDDPLLERVSEHPAVAQYVEVVEDKALLNVNNCQMMVTLKGVGDGYDRLIDFNEIRQGSGDYLLEDGVRHYGIFGVYVLTAMMMRIDYPGPVYIYAPKKGSKINLTNPSDDFREDSIYSPSVAFMVKQQKYDADYVITSLGFAQHLLSKEGQITAVELSLHDHVDVRKVQRELEDSLGDKYTVLNRYEQQEDMFRIMKVEKFVSYVFLCFILLIASFNIISSLSMLIIDKRADIKTLHNLGASNRDISRIFLLEGWLISLSGAVIGIVLGVLLCWGQQLFGWIKLGSSEGSFIVDSYPVDLHAMDLLIVFGTVALIGILTVWLPVRYFSKRQTKS